MKKIFCIIIVIFALSFLFMAGNTIKGYRSLKEEIENELLSCAPAVTDRKIEETTFEEVAFEEAAVTTLSSPEMDNTVTMAKVLPHLDSASREFSGFKIDNIQKGSIIERAGLRNGDIIKVVNGQRLTSPQRAIQIFRKARNQPSIAVSLLRKNRIVSLKCKVRD